jgi:hypothetical protein
MMIGERISIYTATKTLDKMEKTKKEITARYLKSIALIILLAVGMLVFIFALLSGSEEYGGGLKGIIKNSPNALPWFGLLILVFIAWKWQLAGGILITALGIFLMILFNVLWEFNWAPFIVSVIPVIFGAMLILSWCMARRGK